MARRSRMSMLKRQREVQKAEKAAKKRARRQGRPLEHRAEPQQTVDLAARPDPEQESEPSPNVEGSD